MAEKTTPTEITVDERGRASLQSVGLPPGRYRVEVSDTRETASLTRVVSDTSEPEGAAIAEDDDGDLWRCGVKGTAWVCQTRRGWADTWEDLIAAHTIVAVFVDREERKDG